MAEDQASMNEIRACAEKLAHAHVEIDPETEKIFLVPASDVIRLVEITTSIDNVGEVFPVGFGPDEEEGITYPSSIILMHPEEWRALEEGNLSMPPGWDWEKRELVYARSCAS